MKIVEYGLIILFVTIVTNMIKQRKARYTKDGERLIAYKQISTIFLGCSLFMTALFLVVSFLPNNMDESNRGLIITFELLFTVLPALAGLYFGRIYVILGENAIKWRDFIGGEKSIAYNEITRYELIHDSDIILYKGDKKLLSFATFSESYDVVNIFKTHHIPGEEKE